MHLMCSTEKYTLESIQEIPLFKINTKQEETKNCNGVTFKE